MPIHVACATVLCNCFYALLQVAVACIFTVYLLLPVSFFVPFSFHLCLFIFFGSPAIDVSLCNICNLHCMTSTSGANLYTQDDDV